MYIKVCEIYRIIVQDKCVIRYVDTVLCDMRRRIHYFQLKEVREG